MMKDVTINMMVKNESRYIEQTLRSVLPHVEQAIIVDTGSEDDTWEIIMRVIEDYPNCSIYLQNNPVDGDSINWDGNHLSSQLTNIRNDSLENTDTKWVWQVDGDNQ